MLSADVVVAGAGAAGLLIASALSPVCSVIVVEQRDQLPRNKYWLTSGTAAATNPHLAHCVDCTYDELDFVAYDGLTATLKGRCSLWDTDKFVDHLADDIQRHNGRLLSGCRLYSFMPQSDSIVVRANGETIRARLLIDCMGFGSPIVGAKGVVRMLGYYHLHGCELRLRREIRPIALDNVIVNRRPSYLELFPTSQGTAHAALILPARDSAPDRRLAAELEFILRKSHYAEYVEGGERLRAYFGIIPVGRLLHPALDRTVFYGEAGQTNPATSATALTRLLLTYRELAKALAGCLAADTLGRRDLTRALPAAMTAMNRRFQESIFKSVLAFHSDDFRRLVEDLGAYPADAVHAMIFGNFDFRLRNSLPLAWRALTRRHGLLGPHLLRSALRWR